MKGSYILIIRVKNDLTIKIGSLGKTFFSKGVYAYVGSAMNSLEARIRRHLRNEKKTFWHIDYLLKNRNTEIIKIFYRESKNKEECKIAKTVSHYGNPVIRFGSSDCRCESHLFRLNKVQNSRN